MVADLKRDIKNKPRFSHTPNHSISFCDGNDGMQNGKHRLSISKYNIMANRSMMATNCNNSFKNHKLIKIRGIARNEDCAIGGKNTFNQGLTRLSRRHINMSIKAVRPESLVTVSWNGRK